MTDTNETKVQAQSEAQVQEEPAIQLTLTPEEKKQENEAQLKALEEEQNAKMEAVAKDIYNEAKLSDAEKKMVEDFSNKIDITEANIVLQYGSEAQKKISDFSDTALDNVKTKDLGEVGTLLSNLVVELKGFDEKENDKGFLGIFKKAGNKVESLKAKYDKTEVNVNKIANVLEDHQIQLLKDIALLDQLYDRNQTNCKELTMYIIAGKKKLEKVRNEDLPALQAKAKESGLAEDAQAANDLQNACDRFEKKLYDLELTRQVSIQMAPQIRLVQNNDTLMTEKIQSTLVNTIPLWKNQMVIALGLEHAQRAAKAQNAVTDMTNELLKKNANALHEATVSTAKASERGIVDIETLTQTNAELVKTFDEVLQIQSEGRQKRLQAEADMVKMENELKQKLLEIRK